MDFETLRPHISRLVATLVAAVAAYVSRKLGFEFDEAAQSSLTLVVTFGVYALVHRMIDAKINPADAAKPRVVPPLDRRTEPEAPLIGGERPVDGA